ncbi:MAG: DUF3570 domain-containing protein [Gammaproteobacteria bacterium]|jgi:hypothetical protein|nr:DUF3570 domain-containing protein [Gammaproteobacteria bacterium]
MKSRSLLALTASALALPGIAPIARADTPPTNTNIAYRVSSYEEDKLPEEFLFAGSAERYDITIHQFQLVTPVGENYGLTLSTSVESMSGASPWYAVTPFDGEQGIVMSGATIHEKRRDYSVGLRRYLDNGSLGFNVGTSKENDYESWNGGFDIQGDFNNELTTLAGGVSFSSDDINPTDASLYNRVTDQSKRTSSAFISVSQVINQNSLFQSSVNITHHNGFLTDPYKLGDSRPESRTQVAWSNAYRRFISDLDGALHLDLRIYDDDFGINSLTFDLSWYQNVGNAFQVIPRLRYYSQSAADFFTPENDFSGLPLFNSSDYRLSAYGALSGALQVQASINDMTISFVLERYLSDDSYSFYDGGKSPAIVDFTRVSLGLGYSF